MKALSPAAAEVLRRICAEYAAIPFAAEKIERLRPEAVCRAELQLALLELRRADLLELRQKIWGEQLYQIPPQRLAEIQRHSFRLEPEAVAGTLLKVEYPAEAGVAGQLFQALLFITREGLPLTAKGGIHKKYATRLAALLSVQEEHLQELFTASGDGGQTPLSVTVMTDLLLALGLIKRGESAYHPDLERVEGWMELSEAGMISILYQVMLGRYGSQEPAAQHFQYLIASPDFTIGSWYALEDVLQRMEQAGLAADTAPDSAGAPCLAWLKYLAGLGWCELGVMKDGTRCFRWNCLKPQLSALELLETEGSLPLDEYGPDDRLAACTAAGSFRVQQDFEVLVPPEVAYRTRWGLAECAELLSTDGLWSFRLSREKLEEAAERGWRPEEIIDWLEAYAEGGLPEQIRLSLTQWAGSIGRTSWSEVILLACRNEQDAAVVNGHPRLGGSLTRVGKLHFIVRREAVDTVRKELAAAGLAPPRLIGGAGADTAPQPIPCSGAAAGAAVYQLPAQEAGTGLLGGGVVYKPLPLADAEAGRLNLPGEDAIPQMWLQEWREYHTTTAQKIMEQALGWGIKVRISVAEQICDFIPEQIRGNPWRVAGALMPADSGHCEKAELAAGDWNEIRLLIPEQRRNSSSA